MGFKRVSKKELESSYYPVFVGVPLTKGELAFKEVKVDVINEETLFYEYDNKDKLKNISGKGFLSIINNSIKDRIWNTKLKLSGPQIINLDFDKEIYLENIDPLNNKIINYNIISNESIPDPLKITEKMELSNIQQNITNSPEKIHNERYILVFGKENILKFTITIVNVSFFLFQDITFIKKFSKDFYDIESISEVLFDNGELEWKIPELKPSDKIQLTFSIKVNPKTKENIGTGTIEIYGKILSSTQKALSGVEVVTFSAYSHAKHSIRIKEDEDELDKWECSLNFKNSSEFDMILKSILVLDEYKNHKFIDAELEKFIPPDESFTTEIWEVENKAEPKFLRKLNYTVMYETKYSGIIQKFIDQENFEIVDIQFEKIFSEKFLVQSSNLLMEKSIVNNLIRVKNVGTALIDGILIREVIPEDFMIPTRKTKFKILHSSGKKCSDNFEIKISPSPTGTSNNFILEILVNLNDNKTKSFLNLNEFLEITYPLYIISPKYSNEYQFPIEVISYFSKYKELKDQINNNFYFNKHNLLTDRQLSLRLGQFRHKLEINKIIHTIENVNDYTVIITIKNTSNKEAKNIVILDSFPKLFEFHSSNVECEIIETIDDQEYGISFNIDSILPNNETEIKYKIKDTIGSNIDYSEYEPFIFEWGTHLSPSLIESEEEMLSVKPKEISIINEEDLQFQYDNNGTLRELSGNGFVSVKNTSTKNQIWNSQLKLSGPQIINMKLEKNTNFGIIAPESSKKVKYSIKSAVNIPDPLKIIEKINITNTDVQKINLTASSLNILRIEKLAMKKALEKKEIQEKFDSVKLKLDIGKRNLDNATRELDELIAKKDELSEILKTKDEELNKLSDAKAETLRSRFMETFGDSEITKTHADSSIKEIQSQIFDQNDEIIRIEKESKEKENLAIKEVDEKYNPQIKEIEKKIDVKEATLSEATEKLKSWTLIRKDLNSSVKSLKKEHSTLTKNKSKEISKNIKVVSSVRKTKLRDPANQTPEKKAQIEEEFLTKSAAAKQEINDKFDPQLKEFKEQLTNKEAELSEAKLKVGEWKSKKQKIENSIKNLRHEHKALLKEKSNLLNKLLTEISQEKNLKIKEIDLQIVLKEDQIEKIKDRAAKEEIIEEGIENEYSPQVASIESILSVEQNNLDEVIEKDNAWSKKKRILNVSVKKLKERYDTISQMKLDLEAESKFSEENANPVLIHGIENILEITISIENISSYTFQNVRLIKKIPKEFYDIKSKYEIMLKKGELEWEISELKPNKKKELVFHAKVSPLNEENIGTGRFEITGEISSSTKFFLSGIEIEDFSSYSNVLHAIMIKKQGSEYSKEEYMFIFKNNTEFLMNLNSILVLDEFRKNYILDLSLTNPIRPGKSFASKAWKVDNHIEPKYFRKVDYSIPYDIKNFGKIQIAIDQSIFETIDIEFEKEFSERILVQSARLMQNESRIQCVTRIKNTGTAPIDGIIIKEIIPEDFILPTTNSMFQIKSSSGKTFINNFEIRITPPKFDPSVQHTLELYINLNENMYKDFFGVNEILEIRYPLSINSPNFLKNYKFQIEVTSCFSKYQDIKSLKTDDIYYKHHSLPIDQQPSLKVGRDRYFLEIDKYFSSGKNLDEYSINIIVKNVSNKEVLNINIMDIIPKSFEIISSNLKLEIAEDKNNDESDLYFNIESIQPHEEIKITYSIKNVSGETIDFSELESFIFELGTYLSPGLLEFKEKMEPKKIYILNKENLQFQYDNNGMLKNFAGNGAISVRNTSTKDWIWNSHLKLSGSLELEKDISLGTINPETSKSINYNLKSAKNVLNPLNITERINITNTDIQEIKPTISYLNTRRIEKLAMKKTLDEKEIQEKYDSVKLKLDTGKRNLDNATIKLDELIAKKDELSKILKTQNNELHKLTDAKTEALRSKFIETFGDSEITRTYADSSIKEILSQIKGKNDEIIKIKNEYREKENHIIKEINDKYNPQIKEIEKTLSIQEAALSEAIEKLKNWTLIRKDLNSSVKSLKKEHSTLTKNKSKEISKKIKVLSSIKKLKLKLPANQTPKNKAQVEEEFLTKSTAANQEVAEKFDPQLKELEAQLTNEETELSEAKLKVGEWNSKKQKIENSIKNLRNEHKALLKEKSNLLNKLLTEITQERNSEIKNVEHQILLKEDDIDKIKERVAKEVTIEKDIENEFRPKITSVESILSVEQNDLDEVIEKINAWSKKKRELNVTIKKSKEIYDTISQMKLDLEAESEFSAENANPELIHGIENILEFTISIENISSYTFQNVRLIKKIPKEFYDIKSKYEIMLKKGELEWEISELKPNKKKELVFHAKINPIKTTNIETGIIEVYGEMTSLTNQFFSGIEIEDFSSYSNALHAILVPKYEAKPGKKECLFIFKNNTEFLMNLNSILVLDESRRNNILDLSLSIPIRPMETYVSNTWDVENQIEPKYFRKVNYSISYDIENNSKTQIILDQSNFNIIDIEFEKEFSESYLVQSSSLMTEESRIENLIRIKNTGTSPIDGIIIKEIIPEDFVLPTTKSKFQINSSSGKTFINNFEIRITPPDVDPFIPHTLELFINLNENMHKDFFNANEILEIRYPLSINSPNYFKSRKFHIEVVSCISKYKTIKSLETEDFYYKKHILPITQQPSLRVGQYRRFLEIGKSIYTRENIDEFSISIIVKNISTEKAKDINLMDIIPITFEFLSSNRKYKTTESENEDEYFIHFNIECILPNQEIEIIYSLKNVNSETLDYSELESFIFE